MQENRAVTQVAIADLIARRWSPRAIDPDQPVSRCLLYTSRCV